VVAEARLLSRSHPELVITGIHLGHYGADLPQAITLARLVALLLEEVPGVRLRLGSVEATEVDDLLLDLLVGSGGRLVPHLHMPLQSGSNAVLARMRRWHTRELYRERALEIAAALPVLGLGADLITGFPGETAEDHRATRALVEELPFTYLHVFPFSPRQGTPAAELSGRVPQRVAGERSRELRETALEKARVYRARQVGRSAQVVLEGEGGWALTEDYLRVGVRRWGEAHPAQGPGSPAGAREGERGRPGAKEPGGPATVPGWRGRGLAAPHLPTLLSGRLVGDGDHLDIDLPLAGGPI
jgi:threonylcarbamoyladenosine tRNA methylthiotransferase MtaB